MTGGGGDERHLPPASMNRNVHISQAATSEIMTRKIPEC